MQGAPDMTRTSRVFVTSLSYNGQFGGTRGADGICATQVGVAGLGGRWVAWLSDSTGNAIDRVKNDVGPWNRLDGYRVFDNKAQMTATPKAPIDVDENHAVIHVDRVWTGTGVGGKLPPGGLAADCQDWNTSGSGVSPLPRGAAGSVDFNDKQWTDQTPMLTCDMLAHLYCIEQ